MANKINPEPFETDSLNGKNILKYNLYNKEGNLFIQIVGNEPKELTSKPGTFNSNILHPVISTSKRDATGCDIQTGSPAESRDANQASFLEAIRTDILNKG